MANVQKTNQEALNNFLKVPKGFRKEEAKVNNNVGFSAFDNDQAEEAAELTAKFMQIANDNPNQPIEKVLEAAQQESQVKSPELVRWALMSFVTHHPSARSRKLRIPPLAKRAPGITVPRKKVTTAPGPVLTQPSQHAGENVEKLLDWIREDPNFNDHHEHWHIVYPSRGVPDPKNPKIRTTKDRHGELFVYMHRQMLARLDAERHALGLPLIKPLENYRDPIPEGYNPSEQLIDDDNTPFATRAPNSTLGDYNDKYNLATIEKARNAIEETIKKGKFIDGSAITSNLLGATLEASDVGKSGWQDHYGSIHNSGHMLLSYIHDPKRADHPDNDPGVLHIPRTAARDPAFWRWHRHIDDLHSKWQDTLQPNDFSDAPPVNIRSGDIILAFKDKLSIKNGPNQDKEAAAFGEKTFGGQNFDKDFSKNEFVTNELQTKMKKRPWTLIEDSGATIEVEYLFPREYYYYFRVENTSSKPVDATFRVFLVPEELANSRRHWIEMDKFKQNLPAKSRTVVCRDCDMSSVVRQPPQKTEDELDDTATQRGVDESDSEEYCDCGWPFHLLLPRGRKGGLKFKLMLFITDWAKDEVPSKRRCGSLSFCGAEPPAFKYPDIRPMGYPFDRPFKSDSYEQTFKIPNATIKDVTINWVDDYPEVKA